MKISIKIDTEVGNGLMRLEEYGPDPVEMLKKALEEAAGEIGFSFKKENGNLSFEKKID